MTMKYFFRADSNTPPQYSYCEGLDTDWAWLNGDHIEVPQKPSNNHVWNNTSEEWEINETKYMAYFRSLRNAELLRTDKFMVSDYPITAEDKTTAETYRQTLRDLPAEEDINDRVMPEVPLCLQE